MFRVSLRVIRQSSWMKAPNEWFCVEMNGTRSIDPDCGVPSRKDANPSPEPAAGLRGSGPDVKPEELVKVPEVPPWEWFTCRTCHSPPNFREWLPRRVLMLPRELYMSA